MTMIRNRSAQAPIGPGGIGASVPPPGGGSNDNALQLEPLCAVCAPWCSIDIQPFSKDVGLNAGLGDRLSRHGAHGAHTAHTPTAPGGVGNGADADEKQPYLGIDHSIWARWHFTPREDPKRSDLYREYLAARFAARDRFVLSRGWRLAKTEFSLAQLRTGRHVGTDRDYVFNHIPVGDEFMMVVDHAEFYREPGRPPRPAAIVTHTYCDPRIAVQAINDVGLEAEVLPASWYSPNTWAIVITRRAAAGASASSAPAAEATR